MPIYEYECRKCGRVASFLVRNTGAHRRPPCPHCRARAMRRVLSRFSAVGGRKTRTDDAPAPEADDGGFDAEGGEGPDDTGFDEAGLEAAMEGVDENDPRSMGRMMRRLAQQTGEPLDEETDEVVRRLEAGEDPESIDDAVDGGGADDAGDTGDELYDA